MHKIDIKYTVNDIGIGLLESISNGLYQNPLFALREYIQNAFDAEAKNVLVHLKNKVLTIDDDGKGMTGDEIDTARKVGISEKSEEDVGFRGIGLWSGLGISDSLKIESCSDDDNKVYTLTIVSKKIRDELYSRKSLAHVLNRFVTISYRAKTSHEKSFTKVEILLNDDAVAEFIDSEKVKNFIGLNIPVDYNPKFPHAEEIREYLQQYIPNFRIIDVQFGGDKVYRPFPEDLKSPKKELLLDDKNVPYGVWWTCMSKHRRAIKPAYLSGLLYRHKGFSIGDQHMSKRLFSSEHLQKWFFGEIHIIHKNIIPNAERDYFEPTPERQTFLDLASRSIAKNLENEARVISKIGRAEERIEENTKEVNALSEKFDELEYPEKIYALHDLDDMQQSLLEDCNDAKKTPIIKSAKASIKKIDKMRKSIKPIEKKITSKSKRKVEIEKVSFESILKSRRLSKESKLIIELTINVLADTLNSNQFKIVTRRIIKKVQESFGIKGDDK
jgi:molecular chaperone HtpG